MTWIFEQVLTIDIVGPSELPFSHKKPDGSHNKSNYEWRMSKCRVFIQFINHIEMLWKFLQIGKNTKDVISHLVPKKQHLDFCYLDIYYSTTLEVKVVYFFLV